MGERVDVGRERKGEEKRVEGGSERERERRAEEERL